MSAKEKKQKIEYRKMKIADLNVADYNPRKISQEALKGLSASNKEFQKWMWLKLIMNRTVERKGEVKELFLD